MPTEGQANYLHGSINSFICFIFISVYVFGVGLILWHAVFGSNPIANALAKTVTPQTQIVN